MRRESPPSVEYPRPFNWLRIAHQFMTSLVPGTERVLPGSSDGGGDVLEFSAR
jgi:hypothetical protein